MRGTAEGDEAVADYRGRVIDAMRGVFGRDARRVKHALAVLDFAERAIRRIFQTETGARLARELYARTERNHQ